MTSMYALGALLAPLFVEFYLSRGVSWRMIFLMLTVGSVIAFAGVFACRNRKFEDGTIIDEINEGNEGFVIAGVLLLCVVMCIYVGFENGFAYFVDALFIKELNSPFGKYALSIFWAVMIPSRVLVGLFSKHARKILIAAVITIPVVTVIISMMSEGAIVMALCIPLGFASGAIYPSVLTTLMRYSGDKKATATAMITTATGIGGAAFTALSGILAGVYEHILTGNFAIRATMVTLAAFFIANLLAYRTGCALTHLKTGDFFHTRGLNLPRMLLYMAVGLQIQCVTAYLSDWVTAFLKRADVPVAVESFTLKQGSMTQLALTVLYTCVAAPITEELLLRGVVQKNLSRVSQRFGILMTAFLFALMHENLQQFLFTLPLGVLLGYITVRHNSLYPAILVHITVNAANMLMLCGNTYLSAGLMIDVQLIYTVAVLIIGTACAVYLFTTQRLPDATPYQSIRGMRVAARSPVLWLLIAVHLGTAVYQCLFG